MFAAALANPVLAQTGLLLASSAAGVNLPEGESASRLLHQMLLEADDRFELAAGIPESATAFKKDYRNLVPRLEVRRLASERRLDVANHLVDQSHSRLVFDDGTGAPVPLNEYMQGRADPLSLTATPLGRGGLQLRVPYRGKVYQGSELVQLLLRLTGERRFSEAAGDALYGVARSLGEEGILDLSARKFVVMGAGAELAPTPLFLAGNAQVLWLDVRPPDTGLLQGGTVVYPQGGADLLTQPREIAATIEEFAEGDPVEIGTFAYVGGRAREWRLTAAMNAIVRALDPSIVGSVALFISPTSPLQLTKGDARSINEGLQQRGWWQSVLQAVGYFEPNYEEHDGKQVVRSLVSQQGLSYLAAQWVEKIMMAEVLATSGTAGEPITVSANVAGISRTRSMDTAVFNAGFLGAETLGLETYNPATTRWLNGLLLLRNILLPETPDLDTLFSQQIHGGVYAYPYAIEQVLTLAAILGFPQRPFRRLV